VHTHRGSRRQFLRATGALVVTFSMAGVLPRIAAAQGAPPPPTGAPAPDKLDSWIKVQADGAVQVFSGHVDLGQGNRTALSQIVAEELDVPFDRIQMVMGDTALTPDEGITAGSTTIRSGGEHMRAAAAEARLTLLTMAGQKLGVPVASLTVKDGVVSAPGGATASYGELIGNKQFNVNLTVGQSFFGLGPLSGNAAPKNPADYRIVGTSVPRTDVAQKVTGQFTFIQDVRLPGMVHGRVVRPAGIRSKLEGIDGFDPAMPGVQIVQKGDFVGVVADTEWDAIKATSALKVTWSDWNGLPDMDELSSFIRGSKSTDHPADTKGDADAAINGSATTLTATYDTPFEMHASIGPACAVADVNGDKATIWAGTQGPHALQLDLSKLLDLAPTNVHIINVEASGCYGRNGADLVAADAALMSRLTGKPVRVQWMRHDEHGWEPKGPAMAQDMAGGLDADGNITGWKHTVWTPPHYDSTYVAGELSGKPVGLPLIGAFNTPVLVYNFDNVSLFQYDQASFADAIRTSWLRGPAQFQTTFAMESFLDELASAAGADPVEFRLRYLKDARLIDALQRVAAAAGWESRPSPGPAASTRGAVATGRGVAICNRDDTLVAQVAEVSVDRSSGVVSVTRFWCAHDCGLVINPKAVQAQVESNIIQATSRTLKEEVVFDNANVTSLDWRTYPILIYPEVPQIETILINRPDQPATGAGEGATCPVAAAISNAVFDATGVRLRTLPFKPEVVLAALKA
jgi:nicotinate dehydrogenase subunit B